jgi:hypothetical protein
VTGYELLGEIGAGGMGVVYRARDVAVKLLHPRFEAGDAASRRFLDDGGHPVVQWLREIVGGHVRIATVSSGPEGP